MNLFLYTAIAHTEKSLLLIKKYTKFYQDLGGWLYTYLLYQVQI